MESPLGLAIVHCAITHPLTNPFQEGYVFSHSHARHVLRQTRLRWLRVSR